MVEYVDAIRGLGSGGVYVSPGGGAEAHSCFCVGPQNGNPVCPCMMPAWTRSQLADRVLDALIKGTKPRVKVKAGRRIV